jgi:hypothetical protein
MTAARYRVVSVEDHLVEPPDLPATRKETETVAP